MLGAVTIATIGKLQPCCLCYVQLGKPCRLYQHWQLVTTLKPHRHAYLLINTYIEIFSGCFLLTVNTKILQIQYIWRISSQYKIILIELCQLNNLRLLKFPEKASRQILASNQPGIVSWQVGEVSVQPAQSTPLEDEGELLAEVVHLQHQVGKEGAWGAEVGDRLPVLPKL